jgi:hypothetical protein
MSSEVRLKFVSFFSDDGMERSDDLDPSRSLLLQGWS